MKRPLIVSWAVLACTLFFLAMPGRVSALDVQYIEYKPYYYTDASGQPRGMLLEKAPAAFKAAKVDAVFSSMPSGRILSAMRSDAQVASIGWFKTAEREQFARFSLPIYVNKPQVAVFPIQRAARFEPYSTLRAILRNSGLVMGVVAGHSEGEYVDGLRRSKPRHVAEIAAEEANLVRMLAAGRVDFILLSPEEVDEQLAGAGYSRADFATKPLYDIPAGNARYIMYSLSVPQEIVAAVDAAIRAQTGQ